MVERNTLYKELYNTITKFVPMFVWIMQIILKP